MERFNLSPRSHEAMAQRNLHRTACTCLCILMFLAPLPGRGGEKAELKWKKLEAGFEEAKKTNKKIMIDVYTDWCTWCKRLDRDVYANENVAAYLTQQYVIIKLNAESSEHLKFDATDYTEAQLAQAFGVSGYPTIVFFDSNGNPIDKLSGYMGAADFLPVLKYFGDDYYKTVSWQDFRKTFPPSTTEKGKSKK